MKLGSKLLLLALTVSLLFAGCDLGTYGNRMDEREDRTRMKLPNSAAAAGDASAEN